MDQELVEPALVQSSLDLQPHKQHELEMSDQDNSESSPLPDLPALSGFKLAKLSYAATGSLQSFPREGCIKKKSLVLQKGNQNG
jgi:hypothetical protein